MDCGDDPGDEDWIPPKLKWKRAQRMKGCGNEGEDLADSVARTPDSEPSYLGTQLLVGPEGDGNGNPTYLGTLDLDEEMETVGDCESNVDDYQDWEDELEETVIPEQNVFEQLPMEKQGGDHAHSLLKDGAVHSVAQTWLSEQPNGMLGWFHTIVRKGVYMDGHKRDNVVEYWNTVFLPKMEFEKQMAHYIPDASGAAWLPEGKQPLWKKGRG
ncbi:hypothetical protein P691DRAFT_784600 [Macrolepiota fuliginosa MF-IS2]|uniref:Uncharacterized protein n=1 Tax=Macrolepiota fuliginosa MF-IS2 TaxID=1400762 RepID=A0A9P6BVJ4_9AGAR|nr:hypothetical protein P691DRAFT_784600 [Macrolepiota fuliginosa MF-IS2]